MKFEWTKNLHGVLHGKKFKILHGLSDVASGSSKRRGSNQGHGNPLNCHWLLEILHWHGGDPNENICWGPLTWSTITCTKLEGPSILELDFYSP